MGLMHFLQRRQVYKEVALRIGGNELKAELSDTFIKRMIGLMYRDGLEKDHCMLFDFHASGRYGIWMRNMRFPIDVLWIDSNMQIVDTLSFAKRCGSILRCRTYRPSEPARYVVELPSGYIAEKGIAAGMKVSIGKVAQENK